MSVVPRRCISRRRWRSWSPLWRTTTNVVSPDVHALQLCARHRPHHERPFSGEMSQMLAVLSAAHYPCVESTTAATVIMCMDLVPDSGSHKPRSVTSKTFSRCASGEKLRPLGSALSPNGIGFSNGALVSLALMDKILDVDTDTRRVRVQVSPGPATNVSSTWRHGPVTLRRYPFLLSVPAPTNAEGLSTKYLKT